MQIERGNPDKNKASTIAEYGKCAPCELKGKCLFHVKRYGGFKGKGPRNVPFRIVTDATERHGAKEDFVTCKNFVENFQDRMLTGQEQKAKGLPGETITILATDRVRKRMMVGFNPRNEVVNPMPQLIEPLEAAGYNINLNDMTGNATFRHVVLDVPVPPYREPSAMRDAYAAEIAGREDEYANIEEEIENKAWEEAQKRQRAQDAKERVKVSE